MKRKYIFGGALTAALMIGSASCSLDYDPVSSYSDVTEGIETDTVSAYFANKEAVLSHRRAMYDKFRDRQEHWYLDLILVGDAHSDNAYGGTTSAQVLSIEDNSVDGSNSCLQRDWERYFVDISYANTMLDNIDATPDPTLTEAEKRSIKAEYKIFRAMNYFELARIFGNVPLFLHTGGNITEDNIEEVYPEYFPKQVTQLEVYQQMEKDLTEALPDAPAVDPSDKTKLNKGVCNAMLAKLYAEKPLRDYNKVITYVDDAKAAGGYDLNQDADFGGVRGAGYGSMWDMVYSDSSLPLYGPGVSTTIKYRNTKESILEAQFGGAAGSGNWATWMFGRNQNNWDESFTWAKWVTPSRDLIKAFDDEGDDIRKNECIVYYPCGWSNYYPSDNYPFMYKLRSNHASIIKIRWADLLLLKAEAKIMLNQDLGGAADIIDQIRARVGLAKLPASVRGNQQSLLNAYLKERRLELAFEGSRWFDLVRLDKVEEVMNSVNSRDSGRRALRYPFNQNSYLMPIPQNILDQNVDFVQNPGY